MIRPKYINRLYNSYFIALFFLLISGCDNQKAFIPENFVALKENPIGDYKYIITLKGIRNVYGHPTDPITPLFKSRRKTKVVNVIKIKERTGVFLPNSFKLKSDYGDFLPNKALKGNIIVEMDKITINLKVETLKDRFDPYNFNGTFRIEDNNN